MRLKMDGFPKSKRPQAHSTKAVLLDIKGDVSSYANEAFKVTHTGFPVPKGPHSQFGLSSCPYPDQKRCDCWVNAIMAAAHPDLKDPVPSQGPGNRNQKSGRTAYVSGGFSGS